MRETKALIKSEVAKLEDNSKVSSSDSSSSSQKTSVKVLDQKLNEAFPSYASLVKGGASQKHSNQQHEPVVWLKRPAGVPKVDLPPLVNGKIDWSIEPNWADIYDDSD